MTENIDDEVNAIKAVLKAIEPLSPDARTRVVDYVLKRLGLPVGREFDAPLSSVSSARPLPMETGESAPVHLKDFTKQKRPRSANEMAAIVAYYLAELAPVHQRKKSISADDIRTYFKIGEYPLPEVQFTLPNAKAAGYFDALGNGEYQLNAVGHNLVAHNLPRSSETPGLSSVGRKPRRKKKSRTAN